MSVINGGAFALVLLTSAIVIFLALRSEAKKFEEDKDTYHES